MILAEYNIASIFFFLRQMSKASITNSILMKIIAYVECLKCTNIEGYLIQCNCPYCCLYSRNIVYRRWR